jgi:hypothetical protein
MVSVQEWVEPCMSRSPRSARGQGVGGEVSCTRCRTRSCVARDWHVRACTGTRVALSASMSVQRTARTRVGVWPIGALDSGRWLGGEGDGVRGSMAKGLPLASSLRLSPNGHARVALERERERERW